MHVYTSSVHFYHKIKDSLQDIHFKILLHWQQNLKYYFLDFYCDDVFSHAIKYNIYNIIVIRI